MDVCQHERARQRTSLLHSAYSDSLFSLYALGADIILRLHRFDHRFVNYKVDERVLLMQIPRWNGINNIRCNEINNIRCKAYGSLRDRFLNLFYPMIQAEIYNSLSRVYHFRFSIISLRLLFKTILSFKVIQNKTCLNCYLYHQPFLLNTISDFLRWNFI